MSEKTEPAIPITVELSSGLSALVSARGRQTFERGLASALKDLLVQLGLSGEPLVKLQGGDSKRALRVRVHDVLQPFNPNMMKRVWLAFAPPELRGAPNNPETTSSPGFPDGWFTAYVSTLSGSKSDLSVAFEYLRRLVIEIIAGRPGCLVGPAQAAAYIENVPGDAAASQPRIPPNAVSSLLKSLLNLGVYLDNQSLVWETIDMQPPGRSVEEITESVYTKLRSPRIEIRVNAEYLNKCLKLTTPLVDDETPAGRLGAVRKFFSKAIGALGQQRSADKLLPVYSDQVDDAIRGAFRSAEERIFEEIGLQLPELVWAVSSDMQDSFIAIKINDRLGPPILGLQPGELLVNASVDQLTALNVPGRPAADPITGATCAIVGEAHKDIVVSGGFTFRDIYSFITLILYGEVKRRARQLFGVEDVEYQLAQLKQSFPTLVQCATARFSLGELARLMRALLAEGLSVRDARAIVERMLQFDTIPAFDLDLIYFDERLEIPSITPDTVNRWQNHCAFVRSGLKHFIGYKYSQYLNFMEVYLIENQLQTRAEAAQMNDQWLDEADQQTLRDAIWAKLPVEEAERNKVPILTTSNARVSLRKLLYAEMPDLPIIAFSELAPQMRLQNVATIGLDD